MPGGYRDKTLITPALFSRPLPPPTPGEEGEKQEKTTRTAGTRRTREISKTAPIGFPSPGEGGGEGAGEGTGVRVPGWGRSEAATERFSLPGWSGELAAGRTELRPLDLPAAIARLTDPGAALKTLHWGRNYLYVSRLETAAGPLEVVVKQFRHRSLRDRLRRRLAGSKAAKSWRVANALLAAGLQTPEPVMLLESTGESVPAFYVCRHLAEVTEARYLFRAAAAR